MGQQIYNLRENNSYVITFNLVSAAGTALTLASLGTFHCSLYYYNPDLTTSDKHHLATINNRYQQDIKNANDFTVSSVCTVEWDMQPEDNIKLDSSTEQELHKCMFTWMYGGKKNSQSFLFNVINEDYAE